MRSTMTTPILSPKILLIQNDRAAAKEIRAALAAAGSGSFDMEWVCQLSEGIERLSKKGIAAVLLELFLPDSQGLETFDKVFTAAPDAQRDRTQDRRRCIVLGKRTRRGHTQLDW